MKNWKKNTRQSNTERMRVPRLNESMTMTGYILLFTESHAGVCIQMLRTPNPGTNKYTTHKKKTDKKQWKPKHHLEIETDTIGLRCCEYSPTNTHILFAFGWEFQYCSAVVCLAPVNFHWFFSGSFHFLVALSPSIKCYRFGTTKTRKTLLNRM